MVGADGVDPVCQQSAQKRLPVGGALDCRIAFNERALGFVGRAVEVKIMDAGFAGDFPDAGVPFFKGFVFARAADPDDTVVEEFQFPGCADMQAENTEQLTQAT